ncbi:MAG: ATP phosphoribosyltransferase regulatory subunit [Burkholderiales bacterium]|nr:ATP phosphoribosyltransferase regulatory subunit [Burkholderiales bacterium]
MSKWALPEYISDVLPAEARRIESLRRLLLDRFRCHGYELTMPPLLEYVDSLFTGTGHDMELSTFKLVDQLTGRTMGLRADITPQVARIDAHLLNREGVTRLCYCGPVLHTLPAGLSGTREPLQIGAELYGHAGLEADIEIQNLLLSVLQAAGVAARLDLGHVGVFRALAEAARLGGDEAMRLFALLQAKDAPGIEAATAALPAAARDALRLLPRLYGGAEVLEEARRALPAIASIHAALDDLAALSRAIDGAEVSVDLAELRGYQYHSGVVFAAYAAGLPNAIARGGRYDEVGRAFGRARPATGFSLDLRELAALAGDDNACVGILAPWSGDAALRQTVESLRRSGEVVVTALPGHDRASWQPCCDRELRLVGGAWTVVPIN